MPRHLCLRCWWPLFAQQVRILPIVLRPCLVFGGDFSDEDAIDDEDDENGEEEDEDDGDGNQYTNHRHIAMILWPEYCDTEVGFDLP